MSVLQTAGGGKSGLYTNSHYQRKEEDEGGDEVEAAVAKCLTGRHFLS